MRERLRTLWWICRNTLISFNRHEAMIMAGYMAFLGLLALFPFLVFMMALAGALGSTEFGYEAIEQMLATMPSDVANVMRGPIAEVTDGANGGILTFGALVAIWTAANGIEAARTAIRRAYLRRPIRPVWSRRLESLGLVIAVAALILIGMMIQVLGPAALEIVNHYISLPDTVHILWDLLRYFLSPLALFLALYGMYFVLSPRHIRPKYRLPGTLLALLVWMLVAGGLSIYLKYFGNYDVTYGSLAGVMITLLFFYIVGIGFIMGAELNAACTRFQLLKERAARHKALKELRQPD